MPEVIEIVRPWWIDAGQDERSLDRLLRCLLTVERYDSGSNMATGLRPGSLQITDREAQPHESVRSSVTAHTR